MKFSARRSSSARVKRGRSVDLGVEDDAVAGALERADAARSQPASGEYDGATTPIVSPLTMRGAG